MASTLSPGWIAVLAAGVSGSTNQTIRGQDGPAPGVPTTVIPVTYSSVPESCADTNALGTRQRGTRKISFDIARRLSKSSSSLRANVTSAKRSKSMRALDLLIFGGDDCCKIAITLIEIPARGVSALSQT